MYSCPTGVPPVGTSTPLPSVTAPPKPKAKEPIATQSDPRTTIRTCECKEHACSCPKDLEARLLAQDARIKDQDARIKSLEASLKSLETGLKDQEAKVEDLGSKEPLTVIEEAITVAAPKERPSFVYLTSSDEPKDVYDRVIELKTKYGFDIRIVKLNNDEVDKSNLPRLYEFPIGRKHVGKASVLTALATISKN